MKPLSEFCFAETFEKADFPPSNGGTVLFSRSALVKRTVDMFVTRDVDTNKYSNYYFRHAAGTGKTVLLKLFGKELQRRGYIVYLVIASDMEEYPSDFFLNMAARHAQEGKQVALLVDEVQRNVNSKHWNLLKICPSNLLVIGTGISDTTNTPQFLDKFPSGHRPAIGPLTDDDMPEVLNYFIPKCADDPEWQLKSKALTEVRVATGGQLYPFVMITRHLMKLEQAQHLHNVSAYLTSENFYKSEDYSKVCKRCFGLSDSLLEALVRILRNERLQWSALDDVYKSGYIHGRNVLSPLLIQEVFRQQVQDLQVAFPLKLDLSGKIPLEEQIIAAGLTNMKPADFEELNFAQLTTHETGLAFRWGFQAAAALKGQVWLSPEVVTDPKVGEFVAKPTIDFVANGRHNLGFQLAKDRCVSDMLEKLGKIDKDGVYGRRHNCCLFHFVFKGDMKDAVNQIEKYPTDQQQRVYTFVKHYNSLLCGTKVVRSAVVSSLPAPMTAPGVGQARMFSTVAWRVVRSLGRRFV